MQVILCDDSALFRTGLSRLLASCGVDVVAETADGPGLLAAVDAATPDAVVVDIRMPPNFLDEGLVVAEQLRRGYPRLAVLVLSTHVELVPAVRLLMSGSRGVGYLLKDRVADAAALHDALTRLVDGDAVIDPEIVDGLLTLNARRSAVTELSHRERDVLRGMAEGRSNAGIATQLHLSERTVENHVAHIFAKLDLGHDPDGNRRVQAVLLWLRENLDTVMRPTSPRR